MKKTIAMLSLGALALAGCDAGSANAQSSSTAVGNPDSANVMILEQGYEVVAPVPASDTQNDMNSNQRAADWMDEGNVEVAPQPDNTAGNNASGNNAADNAPVNIQEDAVGVVTPDAAAFEAEETVSQ